MVLYIAFPAAYIVQPMYVYEYVSTEHCALAALSYSNKNAVEFLVLVYWWCAMKFCGEYEISLVFKQLTFF